MRITRRTFTQFLAALPFMPKAKEKVEAWMRPIVSDAPVFDLNALPLPIVHRDWYMEALYNNGKPIEYPYMKGWLRKQADEIEYTTLQDAFNKAMERDDNANGTTYGTVAAATVGGQV